MAAQWMFAAWRNKCFLCAEHFLQKKLDPLSSKELSFKEFHETSTYHRIWLQLFITGFFGDLVHCFSHLLYLKILIWTVWRNEERGKGAIDSSFAWSKWNFHPFSVLWLCVPGCDWNVDVASMWRLNPELPRRSLSGSDLQLGLWPWAIFQVFLRFCYKKSETSL